MKVSERLKKRIIDQIKKSRKESYNRSEAQINSFEKFLINKGYLQFDEENNRLKPTEELIFLKFERFEELIEEIEVNKFSSSEIKRSKGLFIATYETIRNKFGKELQEENNIFLCPYCKRSYINVVVIENEKKLIKPDLDHFYPKHKYPYLACSIENLVPSCLTCNQRIKGTQDPRELFISHPLKEKIFDRFKFKAIIEPKTIFIDKRNLPERIKNYLKFFYIEEIYSEHTEILENLYNLLQKYNQVKEKEIYKTCKTFFEKREIKNLVFNEYKNADENKTPLGKLKKDLYKSLL